MEKQPLVSIITPTYNHEKFIGQCIESVLAQSYPHWEQIIIDDGSRDKTEYIIKKYKDQRIKFFKQENVGPWRLSETYNSALKKSQGEIIAILEGDDFWPPWKLEKQITAFRERSVILSWGNIGVADDCGKIVHQSTYNMKKIQAFTQKELIKKLLLNNYIPACTVMCNKKALLSINGFHQARHSPCVDYPTWLQLSILGRFSPLDEILGIWRRHEGQSSARWAKEMTMAHNQYAMSFYKRLPEDVKEGLHLRIEDLDKSHKDNIANVNLSLGISNLIAGRWNEARINFKEGIRGNKLFIKIIAIAGVSCSLFKFDFKLLQNLLKKCSNYK